MRLLWFAVHVAEGGSLGRLSPVKRHRMGDEDVMPDATTNVAVLRELVRRFGDERAWQPFHTPKNLAMGMAIETAELMEHFLWVDGPRSRELGFDPERREAIADEVADVFCYVLNLCNVLELDLSTELERKLKKNALKYPVEKFRGRFEAADET